MHKSFNETIALSGKRSSALGVKPFDTSLRFKLYPGRFAEELIRTKDLRIFASSSSKEYVEASLTKDLELVPTPIGLGPKRWYLAVSCLEVKLKGDGPWEVTCTPSSVFFRPSPPPSRGFCYVLEAAVNASRAFLDKSYAMRALEILKEGERLFDDDDLEAASKIKLYLSKYVGEK